MMMNVVALTAEDMTFAERASKAGIVSLQGMQGVIRLPTPYRLQR